MYDDDYAWYLSLMIFFGVVVATLVLLNILFGVLTGV